MTTPPRLPCVRALLLVSALLSVRAAAAQPQADGPTVALPEFTITENADLPQLEAWSFARAGGFDVLSNAPAADTRRLLADFQKFQQAVRLVWPMPVKPLAASSLILCGRDNKFDAFRPADTPKGDAIVPSLFLRNREQIALVVDLQTEQVTLNDATTLALTGASSVDYQVDHYRQLYREYVLYLLSQGTSRPPAWLEEGLAQIVMDIDLSDRTLIYGKIETYKGEATGGSPLEAAEDDATTASATVGEMPFNVVFQTRKFMPLGAFFAIGHDAPEARTPLGNNLWAKQAYAFVHFCLFGEDLRHKEALVTLVNRLAREPLTEALFKECFKTDYRGMEKQLRGYVLHTRHKYQKYDLKDTDRLAPNSIELADATPAQVGVLKGDALRLAGHPQAAYTEYRDAYRRGSRDPAVLAGIGALDSDPARARKFTDAAAKAGVSRPSVYVTQARLRLDEFRADPGPDGKLTGNQLALVLSPLFKARNLPPPLPETYATIAEAWALSSVAPKPEHLAVLDEGVRQFPRESALLYRVADLYRQAGAAPTATAIAQLGRRFAATPEDQSRFEQLLGQLPPPAK